jgi:hypothetical protein
MSLSLEKKHTDFWPDVFVNSEVTITARLKRVKLIR